MDGNVRKQWALILGGSSGLGLATAKKLALHGFNLIIVHRDRKSDLERIESRFQEITLNGTALYSFNVDAANAEKRKVAILEIERLLKSTDNPPDISTATTDSQKFLNNKIHVMVHSIAKGNLKPMYSEEDTILNNQDFQLTLNAMALSLYDWIRDLVNAQLLGDDARIISFTSEGSSKAWPGYAAVSAAKATLEALTRNIALEFAPLGIKANCIQAGATETQAFKMIPGHEKIKVNALERNPNKRLTVPEDVANVVYLLSTDEARWITGTVIKVDGGESLR